MIRCGKCVIPVRSVVQMRRHSQSACSLRCSAGTCCPWVRGTLVHDDAWVHASRLPFCFRDGYQPDGLAYKHTLLSFGPPLQKKKLLDRIIAGRQQLLVMPPSDPHCSDCAVRHVDATSIQNLLSAKGRMRQPRQPRAPCQRDE